MKLRYDYRSTEDCIQFFKDAIEALNSERFKAIVRDTFPKNEAEKIIAGYNDRVIIPFMERITCAETAQNIIADNIPDEIITKNPELFLGKRKEMHSHRFKRLFDSYTANALTKGLNEFRDLLENKYAEISPASNIDMKHLPEALDAMVADMPPESDTAKEIGKKIRQEGIMRRTLLERLTDSINDMDQVITRLSNIVEAFNHKSRAHGMGKLCKDLVFKEREARQRGRA